jgi:hypothetical protein
MSDNTKKIVARAIKLDRAIVTLKAQLDALKDILIMEANACPEEQTDTEGGGKSWTCQDAAGNIARVTFPAAALKASIKGTGKTFLTVLTAAGKMFSKLFVKTSAWKPCEDFRKRAEDLLGKRDAAKLIKLVTSDSATQVSFETKEKQG